MKTNDFKEVSGRIISAKNNGIYEIDISSDTKIESLKDIRIEWICNNLNNGFSTSTTLNTYAPLEPFDKLVQYRNSKFIEGVCGNVEKDVACNFLIPGMPFHKKENARKGNTKCQIIEFDFNEAFEFELFYGKGRVNNRTLDSYSFISGSNDKKNWVPLTHYGQPKKYIKNSNIQVLENPGKFKFYKCEYTNVYSMYIDPIQKDGVNVEISDITQNSSPNFIYDINNKIEIDGLELYIKEYKYTKSGNNLLVYALFHDIPINKLSTKAKIKLHSKGNGFSKFSYRIFTEKDN